MHDRRSMGWVVLGCLGLTILPLLSSAKAETRGVIELFTSQGCSSCPAADKLLGELSSDPTLVAISLPIDYWDYLGWKDTLANPLHTALQRAYARARGDREVYTPQAVVNGSMHVLGSDRSAIERALARHDGDILSLPVTLSIADGQLSVHVPSAKEEHGSAEVWLCAMSKFVAVAIGRGENKGLTVTYHNVARRWVKLGDWSGKASTWTIPLADFKADGVDAAAVIVQSGSPDKPGPMLGKPGPMLGAAELPIR